MQRTSSGVDKLPGARRCIRVRPSKVGKSEIEGFETRDSGSDLFKGRRACRSLCFERDVFGGPVSLAADADEPPSRARKRPA